MRPIAIFRHFHTEGPGHFATVLAQRGLPWQLVALDAGDPVPASVSAFSGLVFMGGPMSVNDDIPWIQPELALIRAAVTEDIPVLGHCLGGQLIAKALGATVGRNPVKEIGWGSVQVEDNANARHWFGDLNDFTAFHWHGETFAIPDGAQRILGNAHCQNQAFALGKHLALQCHVEMTPEMIDVWCQQGANEIARALANPPSPAVQTPETIRRQGVEHLVPMTAVANVLYNQWLAGLKA